MRMVLFIILANCSFAQAQKDGNLVKYLNENFHHVYAFNEFYIASTTEKPLVVAAKEHPTAENVVNDACRLVSSFLDSDNNGMADDGYLVKTMAKRFILAIGYERTLVEHEEAIHARFGRYVISMKTDIWPYRPDYTFDRPAISRLNTSTWRPRNYSALIEEAFHVVTESYNRMDPDFSFDKGAKLSRLMASDINNEEYDIEQQNREEGGGYDWQTAVNEYIHQIWLIENTGKSEILTQNQKKALEIMARKKGFPLHLKKDYDRNLFKIQNDN